MGGGKQIILILQVLHGRWKANYSDSVSVAMKVER